MSQSPNNLSQFWQELKRRKVIHVIVIYSTAAYVLIELVNNVYDDLRLPDSTPLILLIVLAIGFPAVILISWFYGIAIFGEKKEVSVQPTEGHINQDKSIIVLPFENISPDPDQEYFSDGLTEEIITDLSHIHDLLVISRSSAMTFKGTKKKIREIANDVNVRYVLEGSVRKAENKLRITAQLIDARNDSHIWAEKYNGDLEDIFEIQEQASRSIAEALKIKLSSREKEKIYHKPIDNAFAYDCYKRAFPEINSMSKERLDYGLNLLQKGLKITGENAVIYGGIALTYMMYANIGFEPDENITKAEEFLRKALDIDPELPEAHLALGGIKVLKEGDARAAIDHWSRAHTTKPDDPEIMIYLSLFYAFVGQNDAAKDLVDRCVIIDPINPLSDAIRGWYYLFTGSYYMAIDPLFAAYDLSPESDMHQFFKALVLLYNDRAGEAYDFICEVIDDSSMGIWPQVTIFMKYSIKQDKRKLTSMLTPEFVEQVQRDLQHSYHLATFYSYMEEKETSLKWLENAVNRGFINYPLLAETDPLLENIRGEKRFKKLIERVKYEWEIFEV